MLKSAQNGGSGARIRNCGQLPCVVATDPVSMWNGTNRASLVAGATVLCSPQFAGWRIGVRRRAGTQVVLSSRLDLGFVAGAGLFPVGLAGRVTRLHGRCGCGDTAGV